MIDEIKGFAHMTLTINNFEKHLPFYKSFFEYLGLKEMIVQPGYYYCVGKRVGLGVQQGSGDEADQFDQSRTGLHHFCLSMANRDDVVSLAKFVEQRGAKIVRAPSAQDHWVPGMFSTLFEDPSGIRIEANHISRVDR